MLLKRTDFYANNIIEGNNEAALHSTTSIFDASACTCLLYALVVLDAFVLEHCRETGRDSTVFQERSRQDTEILLDTSAMYNVHTYRLTVLCIIL